MGKTYDHLQYFLHTGGQFPLLQVTIPLVLALSLSFENLEYGTHHDRKDLVSDPQCTTVQGAPDLTRCQLGSLKRDVRPGKRLFPGKRCIPLSNVELFGIKCVLMACSHTHR